MRSRTSKTSKGYDARNVALTCALLAASAIGACSKDKTEEEPIDTAQGLAEGETATQEPPAAEPPAGEAAKADGERAEGASGGAGSVATAGAATDTPGDEGAPAEKKGASEKPIAKPDPAEPGEAPAPGYTGPDPCRGKTFKFSSVKKACNEGGVKKAKDLMKSIVKRAKDDGKEIDGKPIKCSSCHDSTKTYTQKSNAAIELKKIM